MSPLRSAFGRTFSSLQSRDLRLYFAGLTISQMGTWMQMVALPWLVLDITHNGAMLGLTLALQFVPMMLLGVWAGVVADRHDKRRVLMLTTSLAGVCALALGVITLLGVASLWTVLLLSLAIGTVGAFDIPTRRAFVPELVEPHDVTNAVSLFNAVFTTSRVVGPAVAGILVAVVGIGWCFVANAVSFVAVLVVLRMMTEDGTHRGVPVARAPGQLRDGLRFAWREPLVRLALLMTFVVGMLTFNYQVVLPLFARRTFGAGATGYAIMLVLTGIGALLGALFSAHRASVTGQMMAMSSVVFGIVTGLAALAPNLPLAYVLLVPMGATSMLFFSLTSSAIQERSDPEVRGRITALFTVAFLGSTPIGGPIVGAICEEFGARAGLMIGAVAALVTGIAGLVAVRRWATEPGSTPRTAKNSPIREPWQPVAG